MADTENATAAGAGETIVGIAILLTLAGIAAGVLVKQFHYDASIYATDLPAGQAGPSLPLVAFLPETLAALTEPETFTDETLWRKIDGKAELYLSAGFVTLRCQRFREKDKPKSYVELFVYDMGSPRGAFAVFSSQRRPNAPGVDFAGRGYESGGAMFFAHGRFYVEIIPAEISDSLAEATAALGRNFVDKTPAADAEMPELRMFPRENLRPDTIALNPRDVFGFADFDEIFTASYEFAGKEATAFLSLRRDDDEAAKLAETYYRFLLANGANDLGPVAGIPGAKCVEIFGAYEVVLTGGPFLAGVHESPNKQIALKLAALMFRALSKTSWEKLLEKGE